MRKTRLAFRPAFILAAGLVAALVVGAAISVTQRAEAARALGVKISKAKIKPKRLSGSGGNVSVRVKIKARGVTVNSVRAVGRRPNGSPGPSSVLAQTSAAKRGRTIWEGLVNVPSNPTESKVKHTVEVTVTHSNGQTSKVVGSVRLGPGGSDDGLPPPPPNI